MQQIKNLLFDCDGVLYPVSQLSLQDFVDAVKAMYRYDLKVTPEEQNFISAQTINENHLGLFNYVKAMCIYKNYDFDEFCTKMVNRLDFSKIKPNKKLYNNLVKLSQHYNLAILSNNCYPHLEKICNYVFDKSTSDLAEKGIKVYDIKALEKDGWFMPKRVVGSLKYFLETHNMQPQETALFDDIKENIEAAKRIGMRGIVISDVSTLDKALNPYLITPKPLRKVYE